MLGLITKGSKLIISTPLDLEPYFSAQIESQILSLKCSKVIPLVLSNAWETLNILETVGA